MNSIILQNLPIELVNHILSFRPTHPTANIMKPVIASVFKNTKKCDDLYLIEEYDEYLMLYDRWKDIQKYENSKVYYVKFEENDNFNRFHHCYECGREMYISPYGSCYKLCYKCHKNIYKYTRL